MSRRLEQSWKDEKAVFEKLVTMATEYRTNPNYDLPCGETTRKVISGTKTTLKMAGTGAGMVLSVAGTILSTAGSAVSEVSRGSEEGDEKKV